MSESKITVVTPSYNRSLYLEDTIRSVLNQDYPNLEYIIIDGGSTDGSVDIIRKYEHYLTYWVSEPDGAMTNALIKGFSRATGDILCWINSDDMLEADALKEVADFFSMNPHARVVTGDAILIDAEGAVIRKQRQLQFVRYFYLYDHNYITQSSTFWRRELYEKVGGLDPTFNIGMDADLFIRFSEITRLYHQRKFWSRFRVHTGQILDYSHSISFWSRLKAEPRRLQLKSFHETSYDNQLRDKEMNIIRNRYIKNDSPFSRVTKQILARGSRVFLKFVTGCYRP
jgi:glycosyltransferase involved in cell wall biosynthesis